MTKNGGLFLNNCFNLALQSKIIDDIIILIKGGSFAIFPVWMRSYMALKQRLGIIDRS